MIWEVCVYGGGIISIIIKFEEWCFLWILLARYVFDLKNIKNGQNSFKI